MLPLLLCASLATAPRGRQGGDGSSQALPPPRTAASSFPSMLQLPANTCSRRRSAFYNHTSPAWGFCGPEPR